MHKFQGFADAFLTTPANGIEDVYLTADMTYSTGHDIFQSFKVAAWYHDFSAETGGSDLGDEIDLVVSTKVSDWLAFEIKYADYRGPGTPASRNNLWLTVAIGF